jgi:hypothetical protein
MTTRTALQSTVIVGWAGLVVEMAHSNPWAAFIIATALLIASLSRTL